MKKERKKEKKKERKREIILDIKIQRRSKKNL